MHAFMNLSIRAKVMAAFGAILVVTLGLGLFAVDRLSSVNAEAAGVRDNYLPSTRYLGVIAGLSERFRLVQDLMINAETDDIIRYLGLAGIEQAEAGMLSYGGQRLLDMGVALATAPRVLLLDEPLAGLGAESGSARRPLHRRAGEGIRAAARVSRRSPVTALG